MAQDGNELITKHATMPPWGLEGKRILVAVSAGVAAYKTCILVRALIRAGAMIKIVMTESARAFVSAETFQALSGEPVYTDLWDDRVADRRRKWLVPASVRKTNAVTPIPRSGRSARRSAVHWNTFWAK